MIVEKASFGTICRSSEKMVAMAQVRNVIAILIERRD